jgi:hypothetical protein
VIRWWAQRFMRRSPIVSELAPRDSAGGLVHGASRPTWTTTNRADKRYGLPPSSFGVGA